MQLQNNPQDNQGITIVVRLSGRRLGLYLTGISLGLVGLGAWLGLGLTGPWARFSSPPACAVGQALSPQQGAYPYAALVSGRSEREADQSFLAPDPPADWPKPSRQASGKRARVNPRTALARRALDATVSLRADGAYGAGVLISEDGLVLTVDHVVRGARRLRASLAGQPWQVATVLDHDPSTDLALLRLGRPPSPQHQPLQAGSVLKARAGDEILTVGSPHSMHFSVTRGVISFVGRRFGVLRYLQTDLPAHPGSSGGPVLDEAGTLVGLMSFIDRRGERLAFAVPVDYALERFAAHLPASLRHRASATFQRWSTAKNEAPAHYRADARPN